MAKTKSKNQNFGKSSQSKIQDSEWSFPLTSYNYKIIGLGAIVIAIAYGLMSTAISDDPNQWNNTLAVSVAPVLLTIGYCVIIPFGLLARESSKNEHPIG